MKDLFTIGDKKTFTRIVRAEDTASFESGEVHPVYATFAIARDAEWTSRLFALEVKEDDEEGIGTFVYVDHHAPALIGDTVVYEAMIEAIHKNIIDCRFTAHRGSRLIASGRTGQKIVPKAKLDKLFEGLR